MTKEVYFHRYCPKCKNEKTLECESPCNECLGEPPNEDSHMPVNFDPKSNSEWADGLEHK